MKVNQGQQTKAKDQHDTAETLGHKQSVMNQAAGSVAGINVDAKVITNDINVDHLMEHSSTISPVEIGNKQANKAAAKGLVFDSNSVTKAQVDNEGSIDNVNNQTTDQDQDDSILDDEHQFIRLSKRGVNINILNLIEKSKIKAGEVIKKILSLKTMFSELSQDKKSKSNKS